MSILSRYAVVCLFIEKNNMISSFFLNITNPIERSSFRQCQIILTLLLQTEVYAILQMLAYNGAYCGNTIVVGDGYALYFF